ncbi:uncharacterized protein LOC125499662 isoform X2 [Athalia rosae]|uniref:uncharacterized protein LOC125499662 isoform X2 n=1 Tax=Athalia rosae TaxID=37344 RepID=UPI002033FA81|nr:uncharacterized protein LOC125499662 isoform X2 [Athalia rosae]
MTSLLFYQWRQSVPLIASRKFANLRDSFAKTEAAEKSDAPLQFSGSKAESWKSIQSRSGNLDDVPWFQQVSIIMSLSVFMIYFFILREENDIDQKFDKTLFDHIDGLEERQLELVIEYNKEHKISTEREEARLKELRRQ